MKYYYNNETDTIESIDVIRSDYYELFNDEYETFDDYLSACMTYNNGVLTDVTEKLRSVKRELNKTLLLARVYSYEEYEEEIVRLLADMDMLSKYVRERE